MKVLASALLAAAVLVAAVTAGHDDRLPRCVEDAVIIGSGDFVDGLWSTYICGPSVDDYTPKGA